MTSAAQLGVIDLFSTLPMESRLALSRTGQEHIFAAGEAIVRQGDTGHSMYVLLSGSARVVIEPAGAEVARLAPGGFFGEMSMLTGDPRTATVRAVDDVRVLEMSADRFREVALERPGLVEHISTVVSARRVELDEVRAAVAATAVATTAPRTLFRRIQEFLRLP